MKAGDIRLHLATTNRWWRGTGWERDDPRLQAAAATPFRYRSGALRDLTPGGLYVLRGPRRAGKSTEIAQAVGDLLDSGVSPRNIVHAAVDGWRADAGQPPAPSGCCCPCGSPMSSPRGESNRRYPPRFRSGNWVRPGGRRSVRPAAVPG